MTNQKNKKNQKNQNLEKIVDRCQENYLNQQYFLIEEGFNTFSLFFNKTLLDFSVKSKDHNEFLESAFLTFDQYKNFKRRKINQMGYFW